MTEITCPDCEGLGGKRWHESDGSENGNKCPTCDGFGHVPMKDNASERQARSRKARADLGGKQIAVMLTPAAAAKLAAWVTKGETIAAVVNRLLTRSKP